MKIEPILTERLVIREFISSDKDALMYFVRKPEQLELMLFSLKDEAEVDGFLDAAISDQAAEKREAYNFAIALRGDPLDLCIGCVCLMDIAENLAQAELGYFFHSDVWGRGYGSEAARAAVNFGFRNLGLHRVWGMCHVRNIGSAHVMEKIGMKHEGTLREHAWLRDHYRSSHVFGVLSGEWK